MTRLAHRPLVLFLDDLQWGDIDTAALLTEVLRPPDPPALLLLAAYRREQAEASPFLRTFQQFMAKTLGSLEQQEVSVEPLTEPETQELALSELTAVLPAAAEAPDTKAQAQAIAQNRVATLSSSMNWSNTCSYRILPTQKLRP